MSTLSLVPDATVCVPASQEAIYRAAGCHDVVTHPDSIIGLTPKLNWMLDHLAGHDPFKFTGFINGCAMGFIAGHGLRFDESIVAKNDYDLCAFNAFRHRICLKDTRYAFCQRETFTGGGGQSFFRNSQTEARDIAILRRKYGEVIQVGKQGGTRKRDYAGVQKVTLKLPF